MLKFFNKLTVIVLSGGMGTRIRCVVSEDIPKSMIPILGEPFLYWLTILISSYGPKHFIYSTGYLGEKIEFWIRQTHMSQLKRECYREDKPLGTGGGIMKCLPYCREWVLIVNGDSLLLKSLDQLFLRVKQEETLREDGIILGINNNMLKNSNRYGRLVYDNFGYLSRFQEKTSFEFPINAGVYLFRKSFLQSFYRSGFLSMEYDLLPQMLKNGAKVKIIIVDHVPFIDIGVPESLILAESFIKKHFLLKKS